jgi:Protein of unknown function (DUF3822)
LTASFNIQAPVTDSSASQLFIEAGPMGISIFVLDADNCFRNVLVYSFPAEMNAGDFTKEMKRIVMTEDLLQKQYRRIDIFWAFPESILVPPEFMDRDTNSEMLDLVYGDANRGEVKNDFLYKHNLHNVYRVPSGIAEIFRSHFASAGQTHQYSLLVDRKKEGEYELHAIFYTNSFTVMLRKDGNLQVVQNFMYGNPADAAYHLLNVCHGFGVAPALVTLHISGLVDERSNLYAAVYNYFLNIRFDELPGSFEYHDEIKAHPHHFFSHLFDMAACV